MKNRIGIVAIVCAVVSIAGGAFVAKCYLFGKCADKTAVVSSDSAALVEELLRVVREHDSAALRAWFVKQGPDVVHQVALLLDNGNDPGSRVRMVVLRTINSMGSEGLSTEVVKSWAVALRSLASLMLNDGAARSEHLARSFILEGRGKEAAVEFARYPESQAAAVFFGQNPEIRSPASGK